MNKDLANRTIVITQIRLHDYAGSEVIVLELASYFSRAGANVIIATHTFGGPVAKEFKSLKNVKIIESSQDDFDSILNSVHIDIAWIHHQYVPEVLIGRKNIRFVYHHMSPYVELESPLFWRIEEAIADVVAFNSEETRDEYVNRGYFSDMRERLFILNNPAPTEFFDQPYRYSKSKTPRNILVVSNHPPRELVEALELFKNNNIKVTMFGAVSGGKATRVLPSHLANSDVVISIGKTVQYSLAVGVPIYCYDHFGGPGYLNNRNFEKSRKFNFSGRGFKKISAEEIFKQVTEDYVKAVSFAKIAKSEFLQEFRIDYQIDNILTLLSISERLPVKRKLSPLDVDSYLANMRIIRRNVLGTASHELLTIKQLADTNKELNLVKDTLNTKLYELETRLNDIQKSRVYKAGVFVARPVKKLKQKLKSKRL